MIPLTTQLLHLATYSHYFGDKNPLKYRAFVTDNHPQPWCEGMVFGNLFTLGCEADNRVATTPIMSKIEAV